MTTTNNQEALAIITTTLSQFGGQMALRMMGAKNLSYDNGGRTLRFRIGRNSKSVNLVQITLTAEDLYDVEFRYVTKNGSKVRAKAEGIYNDMLKGAIERETGMYLSF